MQQAGHLGPGGEHLVVVQVRVVCAVSLAVVVLSGVASPVGAAARCRQEPPLPATVPTLQVTLSAQKASHVRGQVAVLDIGVRLASPAGPKVDRAEVKVAVSSRGRVVRTLYATTDRNGAGRARLAISVGFPLGKLTAVATARALLADGYDCSGLVYQTGSDTADPLTTIRS